VHARTHARTMHGPSASRRHERYSFCLSALDDDRSGHARGAALQACVYGNRAPEESTMEPAGREQQAQIHDDPPPARTVRFGDEQERERGGDFPADAIDTGRRGAREGDTARGVVTHDTTSRRATSGSARPRVLATARETGAHACGAGAGAARGWLMRTHQGRERRPRGHHMISDSSRGGKGSRCQMCTVQCERCVSTGCDLTRSEQQSACLAGGWC
jgi:hypothetical protein